MATVLIIHAVSSYPVWKSAFDAAEKIRKDAGELSYELLRFVADPNKVVHFSEWKSIDAAQAFFESEKVIQIRRDAGVHDPEFLYLERLEKAHL